MKKTLRGFTWLAVLALLVQGLAACSNADSPLAPTSQDDATIQRVNVIDGGDGGSPPPADNEEDAAPESQGNGVGKTPGVDDTTNG